ncbi:hypothetical protein ES703_103618 [subsurface metagenome]
MQWLIDIIKELIHGQLGYFYRGDPAVHDFDLLDLTIDGAWHDLDLSAIVPEGAKCVNLITNLRNQFVGVQIRIRRKGQVNIINSLTVWSQTAIVRLGGLFPVNLNADRVIEYNITPGGWTLIKISVAGWWLR